MKMLGWGCKMEIVKYDRKKKVLSVRYNTKIVWDYKDVEEAEYFKVVEKLQDEGFSKTKLQTLLSKQFIVGTHKGSI